MAIRRLLFTSIPRALKSVLVFGFCLSITASVILSVSLEVRFAEPYFTAFQVAGPFLAGLLLFLIVNRRVRSAEGLVSLMVASLVIAGAAQAYAYFWPREMVLPGEKLELCPPVDGLGTSAGGSASDCSP